MVQLTNISTRLNSLSYIETRSLLPESLIKSRELKLNKIPILIMWLSIQISFIFHTLREGIAWLISCNAFPIMESNSRRSGHCLLSSWHLKYWCVVQVHCSPPTWHFHLIGQDTRLSILEWSVQITQVSPYKFIWFFYWNKL